MYDDPLSVCCAFEPIIFDTTANELFSVPDKGSEATGSFQHIPMNNSFSSIALPDIYTCKEVITPCMMESSVRGGDHIDSVKSAPCPLVSAPDSCGTNSMESSLSDEEVELSARTRRSSRGALCLVNVVKHSISEKRRVIRFNTCIDEFMSMLNVAVWVGCSRRTMAFPSERISFEFSKKPFVRCVKFSLKSTT